MAARYGAQEIGYTRRLLERQVEACEAQLADTQDQLAEIANILPANILQRLTQLIRKRVPRSRALIAERFAHAPAGAYPFETPEEAQFARELQYQVRQAFERTLQRIESAHQSLAAAAAQGQQISLFASVAPAGGRKRRVSSAAAEFSIAQASAESAQRYAQRLDEIEAKYMGAAYVPEVVVPLPVITAETVFHVPTVRRKATGTVVPSVPAYAASAAAAYVPPPLSLPIPGPQAFPLALPEPYVPLAALGSSFAQPIVLFD